MIKKTILIFISFFTFLSSVYAESLCSYEEERILEQESANVKITYEPIEEVIEYPDGIGIDRRIKVSIYNITEKIYIKYKNAKDSEKCDDCFKTITFANVKDGIATFEWTNIDEIANLVFYVYSSNKTKCPDEKYKTLYLTIPRANDFANLAICDELSEFYLCQKYVTFEEVSNDVFYAQINKYRNKTVDEDGNDIEETLTDKIFKFVSDNKYIIIGIFAGVGTVVFVIYYITTKKQRELGL